MDLRPVVIYHANCADGVAAAWCFKRLYGDAMEYVPGIYQGALDGYTGRDVYFVDFSAPRDVMERIAKVANSVTLLDHHISALENLRGLKGVNMDDCTTELSGAGIAWKYLYGTKPMPRALMHIQDRDLWKFEDSRTKAFMAWLFFEGITFETIEHAASLDNYPNEYLSACIRGKLLLDKQERDVAMAIDQCAREVNIGGWLVKAVNVNGWMASDAGSELAKLGAFGATYYDSASGRHWSLRSVRGGLNVADVAKLYGGGGHANAAGFVVPRNHSLARV